MSLEVNNSTEILQLRHLETNKWVPGIILLQLEGGFGVRLVPGQLAKLDQLVSGLQELKASSFQNLSSNTDENNRIIAQLENLQNAISSSVDDSQKISDLKLSVDQLKAISQTNLNVNETLLQSLNKVSTTLELVHTELKDINSLTSGDDSGSTLQRILDKTSILNGNVETLLSYFRINKANEVLTEVVSLTGGQVTSYSIPSNTEALVFACRMNQDRESFDIQYSFNATGIQGNNYSTLWAYNEYNKSGLNFNGKTLHLKCSVSAAVEITSYYCV